jgi:hypothetical protein
MKGTLFGDLPSPTSKGPAEPGVVCPGDAVAPRPAMTQVVPVKRPSAQRRHSTSKKVKSTSNRIPSEPLKGVSDHENPEDIYDPFRPNDYECIVQEKMRSRRLMEERLEAMRCERALRKKGTQVTSSPAAAAGANPQIQGGPEKGLSLAQKMMEKMGWKRGQGLGKSNQGIPVALEVKKTAPRSGTVAAPATSSKKENS